MIVDQFVAQKVFVKHFPKTVRSSDVDLIGVVGHLVSNAISRLNRALLFSVALNARPNNTRQELVLTNVKKNLMYTLDTDIICRASSGAYVYFLAIRSLIKVTTTKRISVLTFGWVIANIRVEREFGLSDKQAHDKATVCWCGDY